MRQRAQSRRDLRRDLGRGPPPLASPRDRGRRRAGACRVDVRPRPPGELLTPKRSARRAEIGSCKASDVARVPRRGAGRRVGSTEKTLKRPTRSQPLASRVPEKLFTIETDRGLGSAFFAWRDSDASYLITANHVVEDSLARLDQAQARVSGESAPSTRSTTWR